MFKRFLTSSAVKAAGAAAFALGLYAAPAAAAPEFTVDENPVGGNEVTADAMVFLFTAFTDVDGTPDAGTFTQEGQVRYTTFTLNGVDLTAGLNTEYKLFGNFTATGSSTSVADGSITEAEGLYDTFEFTLYYDRTPTDTPLDLDPSDSVVDPFRYEVDGDTETVLTASLVLGSQTIQVIPNEIITFVIDLEIALTPFGEQYFIDPVPFYQLQLNSGIAVNAITDDGFDVFDGTVASGDFSVISQGTGATTFARVPEPATLALLGFGLAGIGIGGWRRRKAA
ncbi:flocculation-associated PEP-CTERM protein PepA [Caenispirillum salinarum]|uniref:flocculation-associated PEP-CTERM protein PepA n=1 Tax=Caenispirillum salinarum TaxID=859058 RepID=UPI000A00DBB4|nr:flocculation-associated PEP-CTERM protein PepA [Caenispirillum salinarum]